MGVAVAWVSPLTLCAAVLQAFFGDVDRVTTSRNCDDEELAIDLVGGRKDEEGVEAGESGPSDAGAGSPPIVAVRVGMGAAGVVSP